MFDLLDNGAHIYFCGLKGMMPGIQDMLERVAGEKGCAVIPHQNPINTPSRNLKATARPEALQLKSWLSAKLGCTAVYVFTAAQGHVSLDTQ